MSCARSVHVLSPPLSAFQHFQSPTLLILEYYRAVFSAFGFSILCSSSTSFQGTRESTACDLSPIFFSRCESFSIEEHSPSPSAPLPSPYRSVSKRLCGRSLYICGPVCRKEKHSLFPRFSRPRAPRHRLRRAPVFSRARRCLSPLEHS